MGMLGELAIEKGTAMEQAKYRVITKEITYIDGVPRSPGDEFESIAWQDPRKVRPINAAAKRIFSYRKKHAVDPRCPQSLFNRQVGDDGACYLPHLGCVPIAEAGAPAGAPLYVSSYDEKFANGVTIAADVAFAWLAWPSPSWRAANVPAEAVLQYLGEHGSDPRLAPAPWCELNGLVLIDLPAPYKIDHGADPQPFAPPPFVGYVVRDGRLVPS